MTLGSFWPLFRWYWFCCISKVYQYSWMPSLLVVSSWVQRYKRHCGWWLWQMAVVSDSQVHSRCDDATESAVMHPWCGSATVNDPQDHKITSFQAWVAKMLLQLSAEDVSDTTFKRLWVSISSVHKAKAGRVSSLVSGWSFSCLQHQPLDIECTWLLKTVGSLSLQLILSMCLVLWRLNVQRYQLDSWAVHLRRPSCQTRSAQLVA